MQGVQNLSNRFIEAEFLSKILISERIEKIIAFEYMPFMIIYIRGEKSKKESEFDYIDCLDTLAHAQLRVLSFLIIYIPHRSERCSKPVHCPTTQST